MCSKALNRRPRAPNIPSHNYLGTPCTSSFSNVTYRAFTPSFSSFPFTTLTNLLILLPLPSSRPVLDSLFTSIFTVFTFPYFSFISFLCLSLLLFPFSPFLINLSFFSMLFFFFVSLFLAFYLSSSLFYITFLLRPLFLLCPFSLLPFSSFNSLPSYNSIFSIPREQKE